MFKVLYNCINSDNYTVYCITSAAMNNRKSVLGINFRYLALKYRIQTHIWKGNLGDLIKCVNDYVELCNVNGYEDYVRGRAYSN